MASFEERAALLWFDEGESARLLLPRNAMIALN